MDDDQEQRVAMEAALAGITPHQLAGISGWQSLYERVLAPWPGLWGIRTGDEWMHLVPRPVPPDVGTVDVPRELLAGTALCRATLDPAAPGGTAGLYDHHLPGIAVCPVCVGVQVRSN